MNTVARALADARALGVDRLDAQLLLAHVLSRPRAWLIAHDDEVVAPHALPPYLALARRRAAGEPLAYLLGEKEFHGLALRVGPDVLVPRPDTETLVDWALELLGGEMAGIASPRVIDLGTGSGAIALAVKHDCARAHITAVDASQPALAVARSNGQALRLEVDWRHGHWWDAVEGEPPFQLVLSNPPYIAEQDPHLDALVHEPRAALTAGPDGLDAIREIVTGAPAHLAPGGWLLFEHGHDQGQAVHDLLAKRGFVELAARHDLAGIWRCSGGRFASSVTPARK